MWKESKRDAAFATSGSDSWRRTAFKTKATSMQTSTQKKVAWVSAPTHAAVIPLWRGKERSVSMIARTAPFLSVTEAYLTDPSMKEERQRAVAATSPEEEERRRRRERQEEGMLMGDFADATRK